MAATLALALRSWLGTGRRSLRAGTGQGRDWETCRRPSRFSSQRRRRGLRRAEGERGVALAGLIVPSDILLISCATGEPRTRRRCPLPHQAQESRHDCTFSLDKLPNPRIAS